MGRCTTSLGCIGPRRSLSGPRLPRMRLKGGNTKAASVPYRGPYPLSTLSSATLLKVDWWSSKNAACCRRPGTTHHLITLRSMRLRYLPWSALLVVSGDSESVLGLRASLECRTKLRQSSPGMPSFIDFKYKQPSREHMFHRPLTF